MQRVGIVIVTHHSGAEIGACLDAALRTGARIVVVDNVSADQTVAEVERRGVPLIANLVNRGFAAAVNQGVHALDAPFILLLNPDAVILTGVEALRARCDSPETAAAGGKLVDAEGRPQVGFMVRRFPGALVMMAEAFELDRRWPSNPISWHYHCRDLNYDAPMEVDQPAGAFLMIRRDVWEKLGGFDEGFHPVWFEDVDFCKRAKDAGFRIFYEPAAVARHAGGHSVHKIALEFRPFYWYRSFLRYSAKHFCPVRAKGICLAVLMGSVLRMISGMCREKSLKPIAVYGKVVKLAGRLLILGRQASVAVPSFYLF